MAKVFPFNPLRARCAPLFPAAPLRLILVLRIFLSCPPGGAQTSLEAEMRSLEERTRAPSSPSARLEDLSRLAGLRELSGDLEGAAAAWEQAGGREALLRGAACFMALGEWERADAAIKGILLDGRAGEERLQAHVLRAQMEGLRSGGTDTAALLLLLGDPAYGAYRPRIYFSLWKFTGQESWRRKLAEEFPRSPEGRIAAGAGVTAEPSPVWLLFAAARPPQAPAPQEAPAAPAPPAPRRAGETLLQTGLFSREANARVLLEKLRGAGFSALTERRAGGNFIAVYVRPGPDINKSIRDLKAAGFDSFPVTP